MLLPLKLNDLTVVAELLLFQKLSWMLLDVILDANNVRSVVLDVLML